MVEESEIWVDRRKGRDSMFAALSPRLVQCHTESSGLFYLAMMSDGAAPRANCSDVSGSC